MCVEYVFGGLCVLSMCLVCVCLYGGLCVLSMCLVCVVSVWWFVCVEYVFGVRGVCMVVCVC